MIHDAGRKCGDGSGDDVVVVGYVISTYADTRVKIPRAGCCKSLLKLPHSIDDGR